MINFKTLTPSGIFSIDKAIGMVLDSIGRSDPPRQTWRFIRTLADTTADEQIIQECVEHSKETKHTENLMQTQQGYAESDKFSKANRIAEYIDGRNEELYRLIMKLLAKRGFSQRAGLLNATSFKELEDKTGEDSIEEPFGEPEENAT